MSAQTAKVVDLAEFRLARAASQGEMSRTSMSSAQPMPPMVWVPVWTYVPVFGFGHQP